MTKKIKILAVGDIHGDTGLVKRLAKRAEKENVDLVILAGDLTFMDTSTKDLIGPFIKAKKEVLLIPGNHEPEETVKFLTDKYPNTKSIHGYSLRKNDLGIFGSGTIDWGMESPETKTLFKDLERGHEKIKDTKKKIMVTHMHHRGSKSEFSGFLGSPGVTKAIKKFSPDILISAHIHEGSGIEEQVGKTKVINVARNPVVFEI
jgi:Icc-related predicted phosphoesterase